MALSLFFFGRSADFPLIFFFFFFFLDLVRYAIKKILSLVSFAVTLHYVCLKQQCALKSVGL